MSGVKQSEQLPRAALLWIIAAQALLLIPHLPRLPLWVVALYLLAFFWRVQAFRGRVELPGRWLKIGLSAGAALGVVLSFGSLIGMEPMVAFLLTAFALKLTEMRSRTDSYVLIFLGYFVLLTAFLFSQDLLLVIYGVVQVWVLTTALVYVHSNGSSLRDLQPPRLAAVMLLQAAPLMLVLFFLFPRIGPLWAVPLKSQAAQTGMSDRLRPGDVSRLTQSDDVAFRVRFEGAIPAPSELYWRGLVMSRLDADEWRSLRYFEVPALERREPLPTVAGEALSYQVMLNPTQQNWLYGLRYSRSPRSGVMHLHDFRMFSPVEIESDFLYEVSSWTDTPLQEQLSDWRRRTETQLPEGDNPRVIELATSMRAASASDQDFVLSVLDYFRSNGFRYTLQPPLLPERNAMDSFVLGTQRGFCEHFAYAFAVMMRAVDIPARIVAGYLGGETNPVNRTVIVHQFDAHAWNEVWLAGQGWVRVDPTAVVAPERLSFGLERAMLGEGSFLAGSPLSPLRFRGVNWLNSMRLRYDALTYRWQSWVVGFDGQAQFDLLRGVLGEISVTRSLAVLIGSGAVVMGLVSLLLFRQRPRRTRPPFEDEMLRFQQVLWRRGLPSVPGETPLALTRRAVQRWPLESARLESLYQTLSTCIYAMPEQRRDARLRRTLRRQLLILNVFRQPG